MLTEELPRVAQADLTLRLHRQIDLRTGGRIRNLYVEVRDERITITGTAPSYYAKQLALLGVQEVLGASRGPHVALDIDVTTMHRRAAEGRDSVV